MCWEQVVALLNSNQTLFTFIISFDFFLIFLIFDFLVWQKAKNGFLFLFPSQFSNIPNPGQEMQLCVLHFNLLFTEL